MRHSDAHDKMEILNHRFINGISTNILSMISRVIPGAAVSMLKGTGNNRVSVTVTATVEASPSELQEVNSNVANIIDDINNRLRSGAL